MISSRLSPSQDVLSSQVRKLLNQCVTAPPNTLSLPTLIADGFEPKLRHHGDPGCLHAVKDQEWLLVTRSICSDWSWFQVPQVLFWSLRVVWHGCLQTAKKIILSLPRMKFPPAKTEIPINRKFPSDGYLRPLAVIFLYSISTSISKLQSPTPPNSNRQYLQTRITNTSKLESPTSPNSNRAIKMRSILFSAVLIASIRFSNCHLITRNPFCSYLVEGDPCDHSVDLPCCSSAGNLMICQVDKDVTPPAVQWYSYDCRGACVVEDSGFLSCCQSTLCDVVAQCSTLEAGPAR